MPLVMVAVAVALLIFLMTRMKQNGFIALLEVSFLVGVFAAAQHRLTYQGNAAGLADVPTIVTSGIGTQMASTLVTVVVGAMIGRLLGDSGAARRIAIALVDRFGAHGVQWAMVITSVLVGITMFYEVAFVILVPITFTLVRATRKPLLWVGLPMAITLSTMHCFLPPHPGPMAVVGLYHASAGLTLAWGLVIAVPCGALIALLWPRLRMVRRLDPPIPEGILPPEEDVDMDNLPSFGWAALVTLLPVVLIAGGAIYGLVDKSTSRTASIIEFFTNSSVALLIALLVACWAFGPRVGRPLKEVGRSLEEGSKAIAMILLTIAAGGAFSATLKAAGVASYITNLSSGWHINALVMAWLIAVILRVALGSATVAVSAAAGIAGPLVTPGISPDLMVLATASGSMAFSHVNDPGFWMFKEYFNLSVVDALKIRTSYTTVMAIIGLLGVLALSLVVH